MTSFDHLHLRVQDKLRKVLDRLLNNSVFINWVYRVGGPGLSARLLSWSVDPGPWHDGVPVVLCVRRALFHKDIDQLRSRANQVNWPFIRATHLGRLQVPWMPSELRRQTAFASQSGPEHVQAWQQGVKFANRFLAIVQERFGVAAVMSSNIDYWQDEVLRRACMARGIPFLVLSKEHQTLPYIFNKTVQYYRNLNFRFTGTGVAVFGLRTKEMLIESGVCTDDQVWVTGAPRLDPWLDQGSDPSPRDTLTLLSYADPSYGASENFSQVLALFADAARHNRGRGLRSVIKCKNAADRKLVSSLLGKRGMDGLEVIVDEPLFQLLPRSRLIIGYNSLSMIEALFSSAMLVVPQWGDACCEPAKQNIDPTDPNCQAVYRFADSARSMRKWLDEAVVDGFRPSDKSLRGELLERYFHASSDQYASTSVERFVLHFIEAVGTPGKIGSEHDYGIAN